MEDIKWLEVVLDTTEEELEGLCARLTANGVTGMAIEDEEDFKTFLEQNRQYWDYVDEGLMEQMRGVCRVKLYVTDDDDGKKQLARWLEGIDLPYTAASLGENDRLILTLFYLNDMAIKDIAQLLQISQGAVKQRLVTGRNHFKERYEARERRAQS